MIFRTSAVVLALAAAACTPAGRATPESTTVAPDTSVVAATPTTTPPPAGDDLGVAERRDDVESDAEEFAGSLLVELGPIDEDAATRIETSLGIVLDRGADGFAMAALDAAASVPGGVLALVPQRDFRGDPGLIDQLAQFISGQGFGSPGTDFTIEGRPARRLDLDSETWVLWQSHTVVLVGVAPSGGFVEQVVADLAATIDDYAWRAGDCLYMGDGGLPYAPFGTLDLVPCQEAHTHEVLHVGDFDELTDYPADIGERVAELCDQAVHDRLGVAPSETPYEMVRYQPDEDEWAAGDRYSACVLYRANEAFELLETAEPVDAVPVIPATFEAGSCYGPNRRAGPVRCDQPHVFQVVGTVRYEGGADAQPPPISERRSALSDACDALVNSFGRAPRTPGHSLTGAFEPATRDQWESGVREVPCFGYVIDAALTPLRVVGRLDGDYTILGSPEDSIAA